MGAKEEIIKARTQKTAAENCRMSEHTTGNRTSDRSNLKLFTDENKVSNFLGFLT